MRSLGIVEAPPLLDENFSLPESVEDLHVAALVSEISVDTVVDLDVPRVAWTVRH